MFNLGRVVLPAPGHDARSIPDPMAVSGVHVREIAPPDDEAPIRWVLLTTLPVRTAGEAVGIVGRSRRRWRVEDVFRVLKSGCRVEHPLFREAERLQRAPPSMG
ncbi:MAG: transposase [Rhodobacteraceae bacterium]|nr:transposase [Paracoccaceae bacterium]